MIMLRCLVTFAFLSFTGTTAFSVISQKAEVSRRDAFLTTAGLISAIAITTAPAVAAVDLSEYKDGPSGLKYVVTSEGSGTTKPRRAQRVKTSYTLYLEGFAESGGKKIDSSKSILGDKPFEFTVGVGEVIKGWDLALLDMVEGEARRLVIPSDLGYGDRGGGGRIPGGATLYFEVQLTENGKLPEFNDSQMKWLEEHPL